MSPAAIAWDRDEVLSRVTIDTDGCWLWNHPHPSGYGMVNSRGTTQVAHRFVYELLVGPVPDGEDLDHRCHTDAAECPGGKTCKHRACVNPEHLEPVDPLINHRRGRRFEQTGGRTHCPEDHPYEGWNLITYRGRRYCRTCTYARRDAARGRAS